MTTELSVPEHLWPARDAAIDFALNGGPAPESLGQLEQWFSDDFEVWDNLHSDAAAAQFDPALCVVTGILSQACESELRAELGLDEGAPVTDAMRIEFTRNVLSEELSLESEALVGVGRRWIAKGDGTRCLIGYIEEFQGQAGIHCAWKGVFSDEEAWAAYLAQEGYPKVANVDDVPDQALLNIFDKNG